MRWERVQGKARARETPEGRQSAGRKGGIWGPGRRWGHTCNAIKGGRFLYVFGGYGEDNCQTNDVHVFDTVKQSWSKPMMKGVPPSPRDSHTCTTVGNNLFVFGGTDGAKPLQDLHILDTSSNTWMLPTIRGRGPGAREGHTAALVDKRLLIFGGCGKSRDNPEEIYYNDLYILDTENLVWERAVTSGTVPSARDSHTCSSWRNKLIILGGEDASDYYLSDVYILDTDNLVWTELNTTGQMLAPRAGHSTVALGRNLFVFGGFTDARNLYDDLHILNVDTGIWSRVVNVNDGPSARFSAAGDCLDAENGILVFIGGCNASLEALDDMFYLHTDMPVENGKAQHRREKLSLRKELKRKCQETYSMPPEIHAEALRIGTTPMSSRAVLHDTSSYFGADGEKSFEATITGEFPRGYTIETFIDGKLLRGVVFTQQSISSHGFTTPLSRKTITATDNVKLNGVPQTQVNSPNAGHQVTGSTGMGQIDATHTIEPAPMDIHKPSTSVSTTKLVSVPDTVDAKGFEPSSVPESEVKYDRA